MLGSGHFLLGFGDMRNPERVGCRASRSLVCSKELCLEIVIAVDANHRVEGDIEPGFGSVADAFQRNFDERGEVGAAVAAFYEGRKIVDLWGGFRDRARQLPWEEDTMIMVFSSTKGMAATAVHVAHAKGLFAYDDRIADHWHEFGQADKEEITIRQLLAHQAGLPFVHTDLDMETMSDLDVMAEVLAQQPTVWKPGSRHGYHAVTLGWYEGELIRRVDPDGRTLGRFFAEEVAGPLNAEFYIGLPHDVPDDRIATIYPAKRSQMLLNFGQLPLRLIAAMLNPRSSTVRTLTTPAVLFDTDSWNSRTMMDIELPSGNGVGEVRAVAQIYGSIASGGAELELDKETLTAMEEPAPRPSEGLTDAILKYDRVYSLGYSKPHRTDQRSSRGSWFGTKVGRAFGSPGAGGSFGFADPDVGIGFAYAPNRHGATLEDDPREQSIRQALYESL